MFMMMAIMMLMLMLLVFVLVLVLGYHLPEKKFKIHASCSLTWELLEAVEAVLDYFLPLPPCDQC